ncbi:MAG: hypothetical protein K9W44_14635 [Candidatus Lokiarchaeota archaeon]|nr:hypothetical protein [Candidatus Harpocratesius repetitus]
MKKIDSIQDNGSFSQIYHILQDFSKKNMHNKDKWPIFFLEWSKKNNYSYKINSFSYSSNSFFNNLISLIWWVFSSTFLLFAPLNNSSIISIFAINLLLLLLINNHVFNFWKRLHLSKSELQTGRSFNFEFISDKHKEFDMKLAKVFFISPFDQNSRKFLSLKLFFLIRIIPFSSVFLTILLIVGYTLRLFSIFSSYFLQFPSLMCFLFCSLLLIISNLFMQFPLKRNTLHQKEMVENANLFQNSLILSIIHKINTVYVPFDWIDIEFVVLSGIDHQDLKNTVVFQNIFHDYLQYQEIFFIFLDLGADKPFLYSPLKKKCYILKRKSSNIKTSNSSQLEPKYLFNLFYHYLIHYNLSLSKIFHKSLKNMPHFSGQLIQLTNQFEQYRWGKLSLKKEECIRLGEQLEKIILEIIQTIEKKFENSFTPDF